MPTVCTPRQIGGNDFFQFLTGKEVINKQVLMNAMLTSHDRPLSIRIDNNH